jgi:hypothetical protein
MSVCKSSETEAVRGEAVGCIEWLDPSLWIPGHGPVDSQGRFLLEFFEHLRRDRRTLYSANTARDNLLRRLPAGFGMNLHAGDVTLRI